MLGSSSHRRRERARLRPPADHRPWPTPCANESAAPSVERHLEPQTVAGHDLLAELGVVHAAQRRPAPPAIRKRRDLGQRLDHQHRRHQWRAGKVPLEELFVDGDVLDRHDPASRLVLDDVIYEKRWVAIGEPVERLSDGGQQ